MMEFLKNSLWEIKKSTGLKLFGGLLAMAHFLSYWSWLHAGKLPVLYRTSAQPICWSLFENCNWIQYLSPSLLEVLFHAFGLLALLTVAIFFFSRIFALGWLLLLILLTLKTLLYVQDVRLSANIHYAIFILTFAYLFLPCKNHVLRWLLVSFYAAIGLLKLSPNWLTGQWFIDQLHVPIKLGEWLAAMSVLVEMLAPVALFLRDLRNFIIAYVVLLLYHGFMWYVGGFVEPTVFLCLLQIFPLLRYEEMKTEREYLYQSFIRPEPSKNWVVITLILFWTTQALPYLPLHPTPGLVHLENNLALSPVAASEDCEQTTFLIYKNRLEETTLQAPKDRPTSFHCNPHLLFLDLKSICRDRRADPEFQTISSYLLVRSLRDRAYRLAFQSDDVCNENLTYKSVMGGRSGI